MIVCVCMYVCARMYVYGEFVARQCDNHDSRNEPSSDNPNKTIITILTIHH